MTIKTTAKMKIDAFFADFSDNEEKQSWVTSHAYDMMSNPSNQEDFNSKAIQFASYIQDWVDSDNDNDIALENVSENANQTYFITYYHDMSGNEIDYLDWYNDYSIDNFGDAVRLDNGVLSAANQGANVFWMTFLETLAYEILELDFDIEYFKHISDDFPYQDENDTISLDEFDDSDEMLDFFTDMITDDFEAIANDESDEITVIDSLTNFSLIHSDFFTVMTYEENLSGQVKVWCLVAKIVCNI